jgi:hypothetical protein
MRTPFLISLASLAIASATNLALDNSRKPIRKRRVVMLRPEDVEQGSDTAIAKISRSNSDAATEDASSVLAAPSQPEILVDLSRFPQPEIQMIKKIMSDNLVPRTLDLEKYTDHVASRLRDRMLMALGDMPTILRTDLSLIVGELRTAETAIESFVPIPVSSTPAPSMPTTTRVASILGDMIRERAGLALLAAAASTSQPLQTATDINPSNRVVRGPTTIGLDESTQAEIAKIVSIHRGIVSAARIHAMLRSSDRTSVKEIEELLGYFNSFLSIPTATFELLTGFWQLKPPSYRVSKNMKEVLADFRRAVMRGPKPWRHYRVTQRYALAGLSPLKIKFWIDYVIDGIDNSMRFGNQHLTRSFDLTSITSNRGLQAIASFLSSQSPQTVSARRNH